MRSHRFLAARDSQCVGGPRTLAADYGVIVSSRGGGIRVSLHGYNDSSDVAAIADALKELAR